MHQDHDLNDESVTAALKLPVVGALDLVMYRGDWSSNKRITIAWGLLAGAAVIFLVVFLVTR